MTITIVARKKNEDDKDLLRLSARCKRDALVIPNEGDVRVRLAIHNFDEEPKPADLEIKIDKDVNRGELARDLAGKLKKDKKVTAWAKVKEKTQADPPCLEIGVHYLEIEDGVLYQVAEKE